MFKAAIATFTRFDIRDIPSFGRLEFFPETLEISGLVTSGMRGFPNGARNECRVGNPLHSIDSCSMKEHIN